MLSFINNPATRQKKNGFSFPSIARPVPPETALIQSPARASSQSLAGMGTLDGAANGLSVALRFTNTNWTIGSTEMLFAIGDSNNYVYFQKRSSGSKFRWGLVSGGAIQIIDEFSVNYLYNGTFTVGASIGPDRIAFCLNGLTISYQTTNIALPAITSADTVEIGQFFGGSQPANASVSFDFIKIWDTALDAQSIENATYESEPLAGQSFDPNLWILVKAGQSNSKAAVDSGFPAGFSYQNPNRIFMITKDMNLRPYAEPYTTLAHGNLLSAFDDYGGFSAAGVTIDRLAGRYSGKDFAAMPCNRGGSGLLHDSGASFWTDSTGAVITTGNARRVSAYSLAAYLSMLIARQKGRLLALEWYQGETDALDGSTVTKAAYKQALTELFDRWRLVMPPLRVVVGLSDAPASGLGNWAVIQDAHAEFVYPRTNHVSAQGLALLGSEPYHLNGQGQRDLGDLVADEIIGMNA